jgi:hypothetical protein
MGGASLWCGHFGEHCGWVWEMCKGEHCHSLAIGELGKLKYKKLKVKKKQL